MSIIFVLQAYWHTRSVKKKCLLDDEFASLDTSWSEKGFCNRVFLSLSLLSWNSFSVIFIHMWIYFCVRCICQLNFIFCPGFLVIINNHCTATYNKLKSSSLSRWLHRLLWQGFVCCWCETTRKVANENRKNELFCSSNAIWMLCCARRSRLFWPKEAKKRVFG